MYRFSLIYSAFNMNLRNFYIQVFIRYFNLRLLHGILGCVLNIIWILSASPHDYDNTGYLKLQIIHVRVSFTLPEITD